MKLRKILLPALLSMVLAPMATAETVESPSLPASPHQFTLGLEGFYYRYDEKVQRRKLMNDRGVLYGIIAGYDYEFSNHFFMGVDLRAAWGNCNYWSNGTGRDKRIPAGRFEGRFLMGKKFLTENGLYLTPFIGAGYRLKMDFSGGHVTTTGHHGYHRASQYFYIPLGLTLTKPLSQDWSLAITGEYDLFIGGEQWSGINRGDGKALKHNQKRGYGLKADAALIKNFNRKSLSFGPFINYWNIKDSNVVPIRHFNQMYYTVEPKNTTIEAGLQIKFRF